MAQTCTLTAASSANDTNGRLALLLNSSQSVAIDVVSFCLRQIVAFTLIARSLLYLFMSQIVAF